MSKTPPSGNAGQGEETREARLARALRENLRRRKAPANRDAPNRGERKTTDEA